MELSQDSLNFKFCSTNPRIDRFLIDSNTNRFVVASPSLFYSVEMLESILFSFDFHFYFNDFSIPFFSSQTVRVQYVVAMHRTILRAVAKSNKLKNAKLHT